MKRETKLWVEKADYDLETAEAMLKSARYLNTRYVDFKQKLLEEVNKEKASQCFKKTKEIIACLKKELKI